uniref:Chitin-binding type-2 domain-containing protein n=1 Tax=Strigamia maritima TaxID=126957 RepID=T1J7Y7_STRMM
MAVLVGFIIILLALSIQKMQTHVEVTTGPLSDDFHKNFMYPYVMAPLKEKCPPGYIFDSSNRAQACRPLQDNKKNTFKRKRIQWQLMTKQQQLRLLQQNKYTVENCINNDHIVSFLNK